MSISSLPAARTVGRALVVAAPSSRPATAAALQRLGYTVGEADDPYAAMVELCRRPAVYRAVVLGLTSLHREELAIVGSVKQRLPHVEVWLAQTDGRPAAMAEALRLGADGLLGDDGLHRFAGGGPGFAAVADAPPPSRPAAREPAEPAVEPYAAADAVVAGEPILTADELRALLQEPSGTRDRIV